MHLSFIYAKKGEPFRWTFPGLFIAKEHWDCWDCWGGAVSTPSDLHVVQWRRLSADVIFSSWTYIGPWNLWKTYGKSQKKIGPTCFVWGAVFKDTPNSPAGTPAIATICARVQTPIISYYFHTIGDGHQPNSRGSYTHYKDFLLKVAWRISPIYGVDWPWHKCRGWRPWHNRGASNLVAGAFCSVKSSDEALQI